jgi:small subunit ribosomal protein S2
MEISIDIKDLKEAGIHFGHPRHQWHPQTKNYIYSLRNGIYIIDFQQIITALTKACQFIEEFIKNNDVKMLYVGTKKVAQSIIYEEAKRANLPYVNHRWVGGTLTNFVNIRHGIEKLQELRSLEERGVLSLLSKKEATSLRKKKLKLEILYGGIEQMESLPGILYVVDIVKERSAVLEAKRLGIPVVAMVDTNANPLLVPYPIPANDDSAKAIKIITSYITDAYLSGKSQQVETAKIPVASPQIPISTDLLKQLRGIEEEPIKEEEVISSFYGEEEDEG